MNDETERAPVAAPNADTLTGPVDAQSPESRLPWMKTEESSPAEDRRDLPLTILERFEEVRFLGQGGMGAVYRGKDKRLGRYEAALRLDPTFAWALKELGEVYDLRARGQGFRGIDASASKNKAVEQFDQALKSSPGFLYPIFAKVVSLLDAANHEAEKLSAQ